MTTAIFISYRRDDAEGQAGRLFGDLVQEFGDNSVFIDVTGIAAGRDFRRIIDQHVSSCDVLLAVIGRQWLEAKNERGERRIDVPTDFVRLEIAAALKRDIPVIPILVQKAIMPSVDELPPELKDLAYRNGLELTHARWDSDVQVLIKALRADIHSAETLVRDTNSQTYEPEGPPGGAKASEPRTTTLVAQTAFHKRYLLMILAAVFMLIAVGIGYKFLIGASLVQVEPQYSKEYRITAETAAAKAAEDRIAAEKAAAKTPLGSYAYFGSCKAGTWNVIAASLSNDQNVAQSKIQDLRARFSVFKFKLLTTIAADGSNKRYAIVIGHGLTQTQAVSLSKKAIEAGIAPDVFPTLQSWDVSCSDESIS
jgi:hypothetical protein